MLINTKRLKGLTVRAVDGDLGEVEQVYFDDQSWAVRYLVVDTGGWLSGRKVLISPYSVTLADWQAKRLDVRLTKQQVQESPDIDTHEPVSRQHEISYLSHYGFPYYWDGPYLWGPGLYPEGFALASNALGKEDKDRIHREQLDSHLRSTVGVAGYHLEASDGEIGHVDSFIIDDKAWAIRYIEIATRDWWPGKKVLISPAWVRLVSWMESKVAVKLTRASIESAPGYQDSVPIAREYENQLYIHYNQPPYWLTEIEREAVLEASPV